ncbi:hypothetical protein J4402_03835 [Candidatus Pacearchaeota archaeon]|nr:hypothetical protein [Candidatus Pacearchaeota archaeon]
MKKGVFIILLIGFFLIFSYSGDFIPVRAAEEGQYFCDENNTFYFPGGQFPCTEGCDKIKDCCGALDEDCCTAENSDDAECKEGLSCSKEKKCAGNFTENVDDGGEDEIINEEGCFGLNELECKQKELEGICEVVTKKEIISKKGCEKSREIEVFDSCNVINNSIPVIKVFFVQFGSEVKSPEEITELMVYIKNAFAISTENIVNLGLTYGGFVPFPLESSTRDYSSAKDLGENPEILQEDLPRIWYYYYDPSSGDSIYRGRNYFREDILNALNASNLNKTKYDLVIVYTDAQFEGMGAFYYRSYGIPLIRLNSIELGGWRIANVGSHYQNKQRTNTFIAEETVHETGHYMSLQHSCLKCNQDILSESCCDQCLYRDDVMSYCRTRPVDNSKKVNSFCDCNLNYIKTIFIPGFMTGRWPEIYNTSSSCELYTKASASQQKEIQEKRCLFGEICSSCGGVGEECCEGEVCNGENRCDLPTGRCLEF